MAAVSANKLELLQIADAVAREKSIDRGIVIAAMEDAIAKAARARYGAETDVHAEIDIAAIREFLALLYVPNPGTIFRGIKKLTFGFQTHVIKIGRPVAEAPCLVEVRRSDGG